MIESSKSIFIKNLLYVFGSQLIVLFTGLVKALAVPVLLGVLDYGYWQIYAFYTLYVGMFTLGYTDGLYLKYGGFRLNDLPLTILRTANLYYLVLLSVGTIGVLVIALLSEGIERQFIFLSVAANVMLLGVVANISLTLQAINQLKRYAILNMADKIFFTLALGALFFEEFRNFTFLIAIDLLSKFAVSVVLLFMHREFFFGKLAAASESLREFTDNLKSGIQLLTANLCGMLLFGIGRLIVEYGGTVTSYAHYAFAISLASVALVSISALSVVIYPTLRRQMKEKYRGLFEATSTAFYVLSFLMLLTYFPAVLFIEFVATSYLRVIEFLNALFVVTVLQGKMMLVNNTFFKALRMETQMLFANATSLIVAGVVSILAYVWAESILSIVYAMLLCAAACVYLSELYIRRKLGGGWSKSMLWELLTLSIFLFVTLVLSTWVAFFAWILFGLFTMISNRKKIVTVVSTLLTRAKPGLTT